MNELLRYFITNHNKTNSLQLNLIENTTIYFQYDKITKIVFLEGFKRDINFFEIILKCFDKEKNDYNLILNHDEIINIIITDVGDKRFRKFCGLILINFDIYKTPFYNKFTNRRKKMYFKKMLVEYKYEKIFMEDLEKFKRPKKKKIFIKKTDKEKKLIKKKNNKDAYKTVKKKNYNKKYYKERKNK